MGLPQAKIFDAFRGKPFRRLQREACQRLYDYPHRNLLIIGQPKSGSTWLFNMVGAIPGFLPWTPNYIKFEKHDLRGDWVDRIPAGYTVTKTHTRPTEANRRLVHATGRPYVVLFRDLRDIAVSWCFYVGNEANHPQHGLIASLSISECLDYFIENMLPEFAYWSATWLREHDSSLGLVVHYESLLSEPVAAMEKVVRHYGIDPAKVGVGGIVERFRFEKTTGRKPGEEDASQFNRKGVAGDWKHHFSPAQCARFKQIGGEALVALGYETGEDW